MPNQVESQIKERIASFVSELDILVRRSTLEALKAVLAGGGGDAPAPFRKKAGRGPGRPRGSGRGGNVDEAAAKIVSHVQANDGQGISAIADATGIDLKTAKKAALRLLAEGALKKSGQKRGTVYHVGSGRKPRAKAKKAGKRRRKAAKRKASPKRASKPRRKAASRSPKRGVVIPARRRPAARKAARHKATTDVPQALAGAE